MSPKQQAKVLFQKYYKQLFLCETTKETGKQCAIIACDAVIDEIRSMSGGKNDRWGYWHVVKTEIEKL